MIDKAREIIGVAKSNIKQMSDILRKTDKSNSHMVMTIKHNILYDKELIASMNEFIKDRINQVIKLN